MTTFNRRVIIWFVLASLILCVLCSASYRSIQRLNEQNGWVSHTYEVLLLLEEVKVQLKEVQTSSRGYVITGEPRYAENVRAATTRMDQLLDTLADTVKDNRVQTQHIPQLRAATSEVIDFAKQMAASYNDHGEVTASALVKSGVGQQRIDNANAIIATIHETEQRLLAERRQNVAQGVAITLIVGFVGLLCCIGILALVFWMIDRETKRRTSSEQQLQSTLRDLEVLNEERLQIAQMGDFLQSCRTPTEAYDLIQQNMPRLFSGTHGMVALTSNSRNVIDGVARWGDENSTLDQFPPSDCWAMRRGKVHFVAAASPEPDCLHLTARMPEYGCVPLLAHGETLGMLYIAHSQRGYFNERRLLMLRTISEQISLALANMKLQDALRMQTLRDPVTQLYNRRYMESSLERELLRARRNNQALAVLMIDVDHFKRFNDTFGHDAGDALLKEFAKLLQKNVRGEDIACRYGGEEFILILPTCPLEIAVKRAEKILAETRTLALMHHHQALGKVTVSIGIALFPEHADEVDLLVKAADKALYKAKAEGRDRFVIAQ